MSRPWVMAQRWHDLLFVHWPVDVAALGALLPAGLELDTFEGRAWLGVLPFRMSRIRARFLPPLPGLSAFPELNVRTYVRAGAERKPGVWFFSLDATNRAAIWTARTFFGLPYFEARMALVERDGWITYACERPGRAFHGRYRPTGAVYATRPGDLDHWLTERYCLYARDAAGTIRRADIEHAPWPLQPAEAEIETNTMPPLEVPPEPPLLHFARVLDVHVQLPHRA